MLRTILNFKDRIKMAIDAGVPLQKILKLPVKEAIRRLKIAPMEQFEKLNSKIATDMIVQFEQLIQEAKEEKEND